MHCMSATTATLLALVATAIGPADYPARIGLTAATLESIASERMQQGSPLHEICAALHDSSSSAEVLGRGQNFTFQDARVIGFFLARSTKRAFVE